LGIGSARADIFDAEGRTIATASHDITRWEPEPNHVEQSSDNIWRACAKAVRVARPEAKIKPVQIAGIGFDATCSLVVLAAKG